MVKATRYIKLPIGPHVLCTPWLAEEWGRTILARCQLALGWSVARPFCGTASLKDSPTLGRYCDIATEGRGDGLETPVTETINNMVRHTRPKPVIRPFRYRIVVHVGERLQGVAA